MNKRLIIKGLVQGIGFRPFVAEIAEELNIEGCVRNTGGVVTIDLINVDESVFEKFKDRLISRVPTGGYISSIEELAINEHAIKALKAGFYIEESNDDNMNNLLFIPSDIATCDRCKKELLYKKNRRYRHPFISCTACGPRYSIIKSLPYDRKNITMDDFDMCPECSTEYRKKGNIRRHAQTIACPNCGPRLSLKEISAGRASNIEGTDYIKDAVYFLQEGGILAIKDIGGYHFACDPNNGSSVDFLRRLKNRESKAFAVMFPSVEEIEEYCNVSKEEKELLLSPARPIVLLEKKKNAKDFYQGVSGTSKDIGAMLPCNPVQILLMEDFGPLIMTSANSSGDTLEIDDEAMEAFMVEKSKLPELCGLKLAILSNNRKILRPLDDSVMRVVCKRPMFIRRARGYTPAPIKLDIDKNIELFAAGGDLKSSFCFVKDGYAYVSQYLGDLETISCQKSYVNEISAMEKIFGFKKDKAICDKHPGYFSNKMFDDKLCVQHHKAHVAAVMGEHGIKGQAIGFAFDGTGYGDDGTIWGSEIFKVDNGCYERIGHLKTVKLIGGDQGAKNCDTMLTSYLHSYGIVRDQSIIGKAIDMSINTVESSSMGRLFDAVSALLDICHYNSYEGQAAIELENLARTADKGYPLFISMDGDVRNMLLSIIRAKEEEVPKNVIAKGFILAVSNWIVDNCINNKIQKVCLSGGTFLNKILLESTISSLEEKDFKVYTSQLLPPGDGNLSFGQVYNYLQGQL